MAFRGLLKKIPGSDIEVPEDIEGESGRPNSEVPEYQADQIEHGHLRPQRHTGLCRRWC